MRSSSAMPAWWRPTCARSNGWSKLCQNRGWRNRMGPETQAFLQNCWYVAAWDHELIDGKLLARTILEKPVLIYRGDSGRVVERQHLIWIWMGDPAKADSSKILDFDYLSDPRWRGKPDYMHYDANYLLIVDNLSDFAHLAFVHTKTLGGSEEYAYKSKPAAIERLEDGFRVERWHMDAPTPPYHKKVSPKPERVDRRNIARMYVPGIFFMETLLSPAGSGAEKGNLAGAKQYRNCQFFTPETKRSTHFFWDYLHDYELNDPTIALSLNQSLIEGFLEDKFIIEGQQEVLDADPSFRMNAIVADAPLAHFRRTLGKLVDAERQSFQPVAA